MNAEQQSHLSDSEVGMYWQQISASLSRLLAEMDLRDTWAIDADPVLLEHLNKLVVMMDVPDFAQAIERGESAARMAELLALLKTSRCMRILEMFDKRLPGVVNRLVLAMARLSGPAEIYAELLYERLLTIHRGELLGQVFSVARSERIAQDVELVKEIS